MIEQLKRLETAGEGAIAGSPQNPKPKSGTRAGAIRSRDTARRRDEVTTSDLSEAPVHILSSAPDGKLTNEELGLLVCISPRSVPFVEALLDLDNEG